MSRRLCDPQLAYGLRSYLEAQCVGRAKARSLVELAATFKVHTRRISEAASWLKAQGHPVGSVSGVGFWWVNTEDERQAALRPLRRSLATIAQAARGLDAALATHIQQVLTLTGGAP
jgi:hypothetical protein